MNIRVVLADDQPAIRQGLRLRLGLEPDIEIVGEAADGSDAVALAATLHPDVVVMDVTMPRLDGISATSQLLAQTPTSAVVILSLHDDEATRTRARHAGAAAFVAKHDADRLLLAAIREAAANTPAPEPRQGGPPP
jgi:DNA-binding NarL/FixJ family response regulator